MWQSKYRKNIKETYTYHVSLEIRTDGRFELRGISPLKNHFAKDRSRTFLHDLYRLNMAKIYAKLMLGPLTDPPKSHKIHRNM